MKNFRDKSEALKAYLTRLGNPYASLQVTDEMGTQNAAKSSIDVTQPRARHPYAFIAMEESKGDLSAGVAPNPPTVLTTGALSKADFRKRCRQIFELYIPAVEKGRLRSHHRAFITRNETSSPVIRNMLVNELQKYDLSGVSGLRGHFNRESELLTEEKLRQIESLVKSGRS